MRLERQVRLKAFIPMDDEDAETVLASLRVEAASIRSKRSRVSLGRTSGGIMLGIEAEDLVAMRAALNSFLRWIDMTLSLRSALRRERIKAT